MRRRGTLNQNGGKNDVSDNTLLDRSVLEQRWRDFLQETYSTAEDLPPLPEDLSYIENIDIDALREQASDIIVDQITLNNVLGKSLNGKSSGPNSIN